MSTGNAPHPRRRAADGGVSLHGHTRQPMRRVHPPKPVEVHHGDAWHTGWLEDWRRDDDGWRAYVRYSVRRDAASVQITTLSV